MPHHALASLPDTSPGKLLSAPAIHFVLNRAGVFVLSEGDGLALIGRAPNETVGQSIFDVCSRDSDIAEYVRRVMDTGKPLCAVVEFAGHKWLTRYEAKHDAAGQVDGVVGVSILVDTLEHGSLPLDRDLFTLEDPFVAAMLIRDGHAHRVYRAPREPAGRPALELVP